MTLKDDTFPGLLAVQQRADDGGREDQPRHHRGPAGRSGCGPICGRRPPSAPPRASPSTRSRTAGADRGEVPLQPRAADSDWETTLAGKLEEMDEVRAYVKNQGIGFRIPYTCDGRPGNYSPT